MPFNLISDAWLPVRRASGARALVRPGDLTTEFADDPIVTLDFPRPDWNAAVTEWLIGLSFLALRPEDAEGWAESFREPPSPNALQAAFAPLAFAFDLDGDGPRAFQDFDPLIEAESKPLPGLLMDAPGENALENNTDLFNKRGKASVLSLPFAAAALITLQTYAPESGRGYRTSMRGGGPLTTLVNPRRRSYDGIERQFLWDKIWANTPNSDFDAIAPQITTEKMSWKWVNLFPWLKATRNSIGDKKISPEDTSQAQAFFSCPRRIRLVFADNPHYCDLGGGYGAAVTGFLHETYGINYVGWTHPLSPYRMDAKGEMRAVRPRSGPATYGDYLAWWGLEGEPALVIRLWKDRRREIRGYIGAEGSEATGFQMKQAKARQWLEVRLPWVPVYGPAGENLKVLLRQMIQASDEAARSLRYSVKTALYGQRQKVGGYKLPDTLPRDALPEPAEQLWRETDTAFRDRVDRLVKALDDGGGPDTITFKQEWLGYLRSFALHLFKETVDLDGLTNSNPHRLLSAREGLFKALSPYGVVAKALQLAPPASTRTRKERV